MTLTDLPHDLLLEIATYLSVKDVLSLKQTCRVLHVLASADYLWHKISADNHQPLDLPLGVRPLSLPSDELQRLAIRALRLEANWRRSTPRLAAKAIVSSSEEPYVDEMQLLLGGKWLLTAQRRSHRWRFNSCVTLWSLQDVEDPRRITRIDFPGTYRSVSMAVQEGGVLAYLVVGVHDESRYIEIHLLRLQREELSYMRNSLRSAPKRLDVPCHPRAIRIRPMIHLIATCGNVLAVTVVFLQGGIAGENPLQILLANSDSDTLCYVHPRFPFSSLSVNLHEGHILLLGKIEYSLVLRIYRLPELLHQVLTVPDNMQDSLSGQALEYEYLDLGAVLAEYAEPLSQGLRRVSDIACTSSTSYSFLSVMVFDPTLGHPGVGQVFRFPLNVDGPRLPVVSKCFLTPPDVSAQLAQVGATGRRAVWLEHNWEIQQKRVMRYRLVDGKPVVDELLPPDPQLPFTPNTCHSLAFDEVSGRLCMGLYNGDVYVLDFV
ncbi:hypothetical protein BKA93DRAFT_736997 [Sparassis latifolia]